ncbi:NADH-FMN oxidoreductase RutF, flavin reductase (DIM6/NTAB) family [Jatrophihabitans endophyticus]|uniref:NADH-FMN oxidoreductase RutF, flavin reductase (DIM6/NTAB) family n=1 Tax=Jatrophihabitans endophyticus TaxID=1206085 RepID=A0A1M5K6W9_9ACTN|nr:flavin reductase family protein [Jatrophihabitans endophyticus]SHG48494.1 NADH-FMN oxidoreductase RutF, flavin reductase (DIM6/NTAB) family [Jatrophihabitans endophyticus]
MTATELDLRRVFGAYPTGVAALAGVVDGAPVGMAASSFTTVSLDPALVSVCVAHSSATWPVLRRSARLGINVLGSDQEWVSRQFAAKGVDRFAGIGRRETDDGCVLLAGAAAWFDCSIAQEVRAGDHDIVVFAVHDLDIAEGVPPLVFHASTYRSLA